MKVSIAMIVCNESQFIERNLRNHYRFADEIIIVEGATEKYAQVIGSHTSTDNTIEIIESFPDIQHKITLVKPTRPWKDKIEMQNEFCKRADDGILLKIDADEFYHPKDLERMFNAFDQDAALTLIYPYWYHFWGNKDHIIVGGRWNIPHCKIWRFKKHYRYKNTHNRIQDGELEISGASNTSSGLGNGCKVARLDDLYCYHYGYLKSTEWQKNKYAFYKKRCEAGTGEWYGQDNGGGEVVEFKGEHPGIMKGLL